MVGATRETARWLWGLMWSEGEEAPMPWCMEVRGQLVGAESRLLPCGRESDFIYSTLEGTLPAGPVLFCF